MPATETPPALDRMLMWSLNHPPSPGVRILVTTVVVLVVGIVRALLVASIVPWLLFIPVVLLAALVFGRATGIYATVLAAVVAGLSIGHGSEPLWLSAQQWTGSALFVAVASGTAMLASELRAVFERAHRMTIEKDELQARLGAVFDNAPVGLSLASSTGESVLINEQMKRLLGRDIGSGGIDRYLGAGAVHEDGSTYTLSEYPQVDAIRNGVETFMAPFLVVRPDGSRLRTEISSVPLRSDKGRITGAISVLVDVEERERAIERQAVLTGELAHRMKNTMAMVQAIVQQTLRSAGTLEQAREGVVSRFEALVRAQDLLTETEWKLTDLDTVVHGALDAIIQDGRVLVEGTFIRLGARAALSLTLVLHELATNALKYGSLTLPHGRVEVRWEVIAAEGGEQMTLTWEELAGPVVIEPVRKGFGTRLIETMGRGFSGRTEFRYHASGVRWALVVDPARLKMA